MKGRISEAREPLSPTEIRSALGQILEAIDGFCRIEGLSYQLYAGTLLGAVRHGGFIPWDDDLDLMMPRRDFERFCARFPRHGDFYLVSYHDDAQFPYAYAKVCKRGTFVDEQVEMGPTFGLNVDVFPVDAAPRSALAFALYRQLLQAARIALLLRVVQPSADRSRLLSAVLTCAKPLRRFVRTSTLVRIRVHLATYFNARHTAYLGVFVAHNPWRIPAGCFETTTLPFEGVDRPAPAAFDELLRVMYGDYMVPPPPHMQRPPHRSVAHAIPDEGGRATPGSEELRDG